ncbi:DNA cytosine methyltransferase [uncultured Salinicola sp.]|uniref:DNA cytosine methyltransferase n=1 Tax=uncultured Salinicola sp. TaxID=1193542 RepID=UPI002602E7D7|nr:DNA cytosine methyltransferase [uncultured Salinicola sp.]
MDDQEYSLLRRRGLVIDLFAGGGGASIGMEKALGRPIDIALNHDPYALALHGVNHPRTRHLLQSIEDADPEEVVAGRDVFHLHASPSCTQFSRSRRALPAEKQLRDHAWKVLEWIRQVRPVIFTCENVPEFRTWGPLLPSGFPDRKRSGEYWDSWTRQIRELGYEIEDRDINAADLGAHTARERLMVIARRDGRPVAWPEEDHGPGRPHPWKQAADHIDWTVDAPSIFTRKKPLAEATMERIRKGVEKFVLNEPDPFMAPEEARVSHGLDDGSRVAAFLAQNHSGLAGRPATAPVSTICSKASGQSLVTISFMDIARRNSTGVDLRNPANTICTSGQHHAEVRISAFLAGYYRDGGGQLLDMRKPIGTISTRDRFALVEIKGAPHVIVDIGYRFLTVDELWNLSGFDTSKLKRDIIVNGRPLSATRQKKMIGNAVVPLFMQRILEANLYDDDIEYAKAA